MNSKYGEIVKELDEKWKLLEILQNEVLELEQKCMFFKEDKLRTENEFEDFKLKKT